MSGKGWVTISRDICDHWLWDEKFSRGQAWIDLILHASHSNDRKKMIQGQLITWSRGQQIRSVKTLASEWGWAKTTVIRFLDTLEKEGMITRKGGHLTTIITVCNYDTFQNKRTSSDTPDESPNDTSLDTADESSVDTQITMGNNGENGNNGKQVSNLPAKADAKNDLDLMPLYSIGFTDEHIKEIKQLRNSKKKTPFTQRVVNKLAKELSLAIQAGMTTEAIMDEWTMRGWVGYEFSWTETYKRGQRQPQRPTLSVGQNVNDIDHTIPEGFKF